MTPTWWPLGVSPRAPGETLIVTDRSVYLTFLPISLLSPWHESSFSELFGRNNGRIKFMDLTIVRVPTKKASYIAKRHRHTNKTKLTESIFIFFGTTWEKMAIGQRFSFVSLESPLLTIFLLQWRRVPRDRAIPNCEKEEQNKGRWYFSFRPEWRGAKYVYVTQCSENVSVFASPPFSFLNERVSLVDRPSMPFVLTSTSWASTLQVQATLWDLDTV